MDTHTYSPYHNRDYPRHFSPRKQETSNVYKAHKKSYDSIDVHALAKEQQDRKENTKNSAHRTNDIRKNILDQIVALGKFTASIISSGCCDVKKEFFKPAIAFYRLHGKPAPHLEKCGVET